MRRFKYLIGFAVLVFILYFTYSISLNSGMLDDITVPSNPACSALAVSPGTEDVTIDKATGMVFVSADNRRSTMVSPVGANGIYAFDLTNPATLSRVSLDAPKDFHPHGISLWAGETGKRLFVINHRSTGENSVEIFSVGATGMLSHLKSVMLDAVHSPNDVHAVGPEAFYFTNDKGYKTGLMNKLEAYLALPFASVAYYDGIEVRKVVTGLRYANGINQSLDGKHIYVSEILPRTVTVFRRDAVDGSLDKLRVLDVNSGPDNIEVDSEGNLWVAGHQNLFTFLGHASDASKPSPSHVMKLDPTSGLSKDIYYDSGETISASSVGAVHEQTLIVGAVFDGHILICSLK